MRLISSLSNSGLVNRGLLCLGGLLCALTMGGHAAAQDASSSWELRFTPYIWLAGFSGDFGAVVDKPPTAAHVDAGEIFNNLSGFGMASAEARYGDWGLLGDYNHLAIAGDHNLTVGRVSASGKIEVSTTNGTLAAFGRIYSSDRFTFDLLAGTRYTSVSMTTSARVNNLERSGKQTLEGWDPIIGARGSMATGRKGSISAYADIGGFGVWSDLLYQALGSYNYRFTRNVTGTVGLRVYGVDLSRDSGDYHVTVFGPIMGVSFVF